MAEFDKWPEQQRKAMGRVAAGLADGDLEPLADYFRLGFTEIVPSLARELADMIDSHEGTTPYRLETVARRKGYQGWSSALEAHDRKMQIGVFMKLRLDQIGRGGFDSACKETMAKFDVGERTAANCYSYVKTYLDNCRTSPDWDQWEYIKQVYCND